jgi:hypothetical protein
VFSDVWGVAPESAGHFKYYASFIDDYSKFTWIYLIKFKSKVLKKFHEFQALVERLFDRKIIAMQTDCGGEYEKLNSFLTKIASFTLFYVLMLTNRTAQRKRSTGI